VIKELPFLDNAGCIFWKSAVILLSLQWLSYDERSHIVNTHKFDLKECAQKLITFLSFALILLLPLISQPVSA
jgi:hypothetical protein